MTALSLGADGWVAGIPRCPSDNRAPREGGVELVVIHGISLPPGQFGGDDVIHLFTNRLRTGGAPEYESLRQLRVSAHFFIRRDGLLMQFVSCHEIAWHAGESVWRGRTQCNNFSIGIELEGCDDYPYDDLQYQRLASLFAALRAAYPSVQVVGHCHISPGRKTDPGPAFHWPTLFGLIGECYDGRPAA